MAGIASIKSLTLDLPPSCIEFWPLNSQYAVVGTYNLEKPAADQEIVEADNAETKRVYQRNGSLILIRVVNDDVEILQTLPTPSAILDLHFIPRHGAPSVFGVASSTGCFHLYAITDADGVPLNGPFGPDTKPKITHTKELQYFTDDVLITAFAWDPKGPHVGMTLSTGEVYLGHVYVDHPTASICCHDLEAWTLSFLPNGLGLYTGGDDSALKYRPLPSNTESLFDQDIRQVFGDGPRLVWTDKRTHGAGVTAILPLPFTTFNTNLVITGSYDDHIRLLDVTMGGRRGVLAEMNLGGGVWRLKRLDPETNSSSVLLLVSCMHAGTRIVKLSQSGQEDEEGWTFEVLAKFEEHKSMNYGSDSQVHVNKDGKRTIVSTSFYDRLLCLWRF